jgi:hypothetical protein
MPGSISSYMDSSDNELTQIFKVLGLLQMNLQAKNGVCEASFHFKLQLNTSRYLIVPTNKNIND